MKAARKLVKGCYMDIDLELYSIIQKYGIYDSTPELKDIYNYDLFVQKINRIFERFGNGECVAIRGGGEHTRAMLDVLSDNNRSKIRYIIDSNTKQKTFEYGAHEFKIISPEEETKKWIDIIVISTYEQKIEYALDLCNIAYGEGIIIIDPYEELETEGVFFREAFYKYKDMMHKKITYFDTINAYKRLRWTNDKNIKKYCLKRLVA